MFKASPVPPKQLSPFLSDVRLGNYEKGESTGANFFSSLWYLVFGGWLESEYTYTATYGLVSSYLSGNFPQRSQLLYSTVHYFNVQSKACIPPLLSKAKTSSNIDCITAKKYIMCRFRTRVSRLHRRERPGIRPGEEGAGAVIVGSREKRDWNKKERRDGHRRRIYGWISAGAQAQSKSRRGDRRLSENRMSANGVYLEFKRKPVNKVKPQEINMPVCTV